MCRRREALLNAVSSSSLRRSRSTPWACPHRAQTILTAQLMAPMMQLVSAWVKKSRGYSFGGTKRTPPARRCAERNVCWNRVGSIDLGLLADYLRVASRLRAPKRPHNRVGRTSFTAASASTAARWFYVLGGEHWAQALAITARNGARRRSCPLPRLELLRRTAPRKRQDRMLRTLLAVPQARRDQEAAACRRSGQSSEANVSAVSR